MLVGKYLAISYEKQTIRKCRENDLKMKILSVVETSIYVDDLDATEDFYQRILGLKVIAKEPGRHVFFQVGQSNVLLAFHPQTTCTGDTLPHHGATGPGHLALGSRISNEAKLLPNVSVPGLKALASGLLALQAQSHLDDLLARNSDRRLSEQEAKELDELIEQIDELNLLKARDAFTLSRHSENQ